MRWLQKLREYELNYVVPHSIQYLQKLRLYELNQIVPLIPQDSKILEIGAGAGWQAKILAESGFDVKAIDIQASLYNKDRIWPVVQYDGMIIPFEDDYFDVVFSSNVLEHIPHIEQFQHEIKRVLKPDGVAIHILPTSVWRFWTIISHYVHYAKVTLQFLFLKVDNKLSNSQVRESKQSPNQQSIFVTLRNVLFPPRHGEKGNLITEFYFFSRFHWILLFRKTGWKIEQILPNQLFYSGYLIFDSLSLEFRHKISYVLGSPCQVYVMRQQVRE
jgi:ubiquinone/menaquinone biosynthesis C-methylase UbiE